MEKDEQLKLVLIDAPKVTQDEATELMVYHLAMAATYFEAAVDDKAPALGEMIRIMTRDDKRTEEEIPQLVAGVAWLDIMLSMYDDMKKDDPE